jgi:hypothetical protein
MAALAQNGFGLEPIRPVPPMTTIFMVYPPLSKKALLLNKPLTVSLTTLSASNATSTRIGRCGHASESPL